MSGCNGLLADSDICLLQDECGDSLLPRVELEMQHVDLLPPADIIHAGNTFSTKKIQTSKKTLRFSITNIGHADFSHLLESINEYAIYTAVSNPSPEGLKSQHLPHV